MMNPQLVAQWRRYGADFLYTDLVSALVVTTLLVPQSLAYAMLAGLPPETGLYANILPALAYAVWGGSSVVAVGPVAVIALMTAQAIAAGTSLGMDAQQAALALALEVGGILWLGSRLRLDALASLLSAPALQGFSIGTSLVIAASQLPALVGASVQGTSVRELLLGWADAQRNWHIPTLAFGLGTVLLLLAVRRASTHARLHALPGAKHLLRLAPIVVLGVGAALAYSGGRFVHGVAIVGTIPPLDWPWSLPHLNVAQAVALLPGALLIALVGYVQSLSIGDSLSLRLGERVDARREMTGLATANLAAAFGSGFPVSGSFSRSVVALDAGARTRAAGVWTALFMVLASLGLGAVLGWLPKAMLAATIVVAVLPLITLAPLRHAWKFDGLEGSILVGTLVLTVLINMQWALSFGVVLSIALLLQRAARPHIAQTGCLAGTEHYRNILRYTVTLTPGVLSLRFDGSLLFINTRDLLNQVQAQLEVRRRLAPATKVSRVVLQMTPVNDIDFTGLEALRNLHDQLAGEGIQLDVSEIKGPVQQRLEAGQWHSWFKGRVFVNHHQAMMAQKENCLA